MLCERVAMYDLPRDAVMLAVEDALLQTRLYLREFGDCQPGGCLPAKLARRLRRTAQRVSEITVRAWRIGECGCLVAVMRNLEDVDLPSRDLPDNEFRFGVFFDTAIRYAIAKRLGSGPYWVQRGIVRVTD